VFVSKSACIEERVYQMSAVLPTPSKTTMQLILYYMQEKKKKEHAVQEKKRYLIRLSRSQETTDDTQDTYTNNYGSLSAK
jgi:hypothetical protein